MKQIDKDRKELQRLVEAYGKQDVLKFVKHLNEAYTGDYVEDIIAELQAPVALAFRNRGFDFDFFMGEDYNDTDAEGYVYVYPNTLWNGGPAEQEEIERTWMPKGADESFGGIILAPALLINPDTKDVRYVVGYEEDESGEGNEYEVQYSDPATFATDFARMFSYARNHHETYDHIISHWMHYATKI